MVTSSLPYRSANAPDLQPDATTAIGRRVIDTDFARIKLIQAAIFALSDVGHNHIGASLQRHDSALGMQTLHRRGGWDIDVGHEQPHHRHRAQGSF